MLLSDESKISQSNLESSVVGIIKTEQLEKNVKDIICSELNVATCIVVNLKYEEAIFYKYYLVVKIVIKF